MESQEFEQSNEVLSTTAFHQWAKENLEGAVQSDSDSDRSSLHAVNVPRKLKNTILEILDKVKDRKHILEFN